MLTLTKSSEVKSMDEYIEKINDVEVNKTRKLFEYELNAKTTKKKLEKGAKRAPFEIVENSTSSNIIFSVGAWHQIVLPTVSYWNTVKDNEVCKIGSDVITITSVKQGKDLTGKNVDTQVNFLLNNQKIVCHLYNTTQLILCNGNGYKDLINLFLTVSIF